MFKKFMLLGVGLAVFASAFIGVKAASASGPNIWTNDNDYYVGQPVQFCYTVPGGGYFWIEDLLPNGTKTVLQSGYSFIGGGNCVWATATPPTGFECLRITFWYFDGAITANQTCFTVFYLY
jgi:hypothetical protein